MNTLGDRIKSLRGKNPQRWLSDTLTIPQTTLSNYENNKSELNFAMIEAITTIFSVNTDWLLFGRGPMRTGEPPRTHETPQNIDGMPTTSCAHCAKLERVEEERRELSTENRRLWKENGDLRERCAKLEVR